MFCTELAYLKLYSDKNTQESLLWCEIILVAKTKPSAVWERHVAGKCFQNVCRWVGDLPSTMLKILFYWSKQNTLSSLLSKCFTRNRHWFSMDELYICLSDAFQKAKINFMKVKKIRHVKVPGFVLHCEEKLPIAKYFLNLTESCLKMNKLIDYRKSSIKPPGGLFNFWPLRGGD